MYTGDAGAIFIMHEVKRLICSHMGLPVSPFWRALIGELQLICSHMHGSFCVTLLEGSIW